MDIGIDSFVAVAPDPATGLAPSPTMRMAALLEEVETADRAGVDTFGVGEHHRREFLDASPAVILAAAAARTSRLRLTSAVTVLSTADPVRVFQDFATLDLISGGRAEIVVGRGSFNEAYPLYGFAEADYDALFAEKLELLLAIGGQERLSWSGRYRPPIDRQGVYPRPHQARLPVWVGVGGTPRSFERAGALGLPLMIAVIGGAFARFRPLVDLYRDAGRRAGHPADSLKVGVHAIGFVAETSAEARNLFFPGWSHMFTTIGRERGWPPTSRRQFDAMCDPDGAYLIGDPASVAAKTLDASNALGGLARLTFQMSTAALEPAAMNRSVDLLGREVAPGVRRATKDRDHG